MTTHGPVPYLEPRGDQVVTRKQSTPCNTIQLERLTSSNLESVGSSPGDYLYYLLPWQSGCIYVHGAYTATPLCVSVCACVRACVHACVRACVGVCACVCVCKGSV